MDSGYQFDLMPLDTPDDSPEWSEYLDVFRFGLLQPRPSDEGVTTYRTHRRADGATLGRVTAEGPGLKGRAVVAAFATAPSTINCGRGPVDAMIINTIAVRPSHRRRGILKHMMRRHLDGALADGKVLATLTASEATIYGRFGFGIASHRQPVHVDARRFAFRPGVPVAEGSVEYVHPSFLADHWHRIVGEHQARYRGAVGHLHMHHLLDTGQWDPAENAPSKALRCVVHFAPDGQVDGFALFTHKGWDEEPITVEVRKVCAAEPAVQRALWLALVELDLVERLTYPLASRQDPLAGALVDQWAVQPQKGDDPVWLRILDLPSATAQRRFDGEGEVVVGISDPMGYCDGTWRIRAEEGNGTAERTETEPEVRLPVDALATIWHGDSRASELALSGLIVGEAEAITKLTRLFAVDEPPVNLATY